MAWNPTVFSFLAFLSTGLFGALVVVGWRRRWTDVAPAFMALMGVGVAWSFCYGVQIGFTTVAEQLVWQRATFSVSAFIPAAFLVFAARYTGWWSLLNPRRVAALVGEAVLFGVLTWTNPLHGLVWKNAVLHGRAVSPALDLAFGPAYYAHIVFAYLVVTTAIGLLGTIFLERKLMFYTQAGLLVLGAFPAFLAHILYTLGLGPIPGLDLTPFVFVVTGTLYGLALFHFDLLERMPVAHQRALEITGDGLLVVDAKGRFVDANPIARRVLGLPQPLDSPVSEYLGVDSLAELDGTTEFLVDAGARHAYDLHVSDLTDPHGAITGHAVVLRDVTDRHDSEERLAVTNRVLRHNLRNDMNVIEGYACLLERRAQSADDAQYAATIRETADDLIALSEKARQMITVQQRREAGEPAADAVAVVSELVADLRTECPGVSVAVTVPDSARVETVSETALRLAVWNLLENAVRHNDAPEPELAVTVEHLVDRVHVQITDNGPGLPPMEEDVLESGVQTPLHHGQGLGLWLTYWIVTTTGGEIDVESNRGEGTTISLLFLAADENEDAPTE